MRLEAITPKGKGFDPDLSLIGRELSRIGRAGQGEAQEYPAPRTRYRRTGKLSKAWDVRGPVREGDTLAVILGTNLAYARYVKGLKKKDPKQRRLFKKYGWASIEDDMEKAFKAHKDGLIAAIQDKAV